MRTKLLSLMIGLSFLCGYANVYTPSTHSMEGLWIKNLSGEYYWSAIDANGNVTPIFKLSEVLEELGGSTEAAVSKNGVTHYFTSLVTANNDYRNMHYQFDVLTGEVLYSNIFSVQNDGSKTVLSATYDAKNDKIYVLTDAYGSGASLQTYNSETQEFTFVADLTNVRDICYCPADEKIYYLNNDLRDHEIGILNIKSDNTIESSRVAGFYTENLITEMEYYDGYFYVSGWDPGNLYRINPTTSECRECCKYDVADWIGLLVNPDNNCVAHSPAKPIVTINFPEADLSGSIDIKLPEYTINGDKISESVKFTLSVDSADATEYQGAPGEVVSIPVELPAGQHRYCVIPYIETATETLRGVANRNLFFIGPDAPMPPQNVNISETLISWDAVGNFGVNNGHVSDVAYNVFLKGVKLNDEPIKETQYPISLKTDSALTTYYAQVEAISNSLISSKTRSNKIMVGKSKSLPFYMAPTVDDFNNSIIIDKDGDGFTWILDNVGRGFYHNMAIGDHLEDWAYLSKVSFDTPNQFYVFECNLSRSSMDMSIEIAICDSIDTDTTDVIAKFNQTVNENTVIYRHFYLENAGDMYPAIKTGSPCGVIYAKEFKINSLNSPVLDFTGCLWNSKSARFSWGVVNILDEKFEPVEYILYRDGEERTRIEYGARFYTDSGFGTSGKHEYSMALSYNYNGKNYISSPTEIVSIVYSGIDDIDSDENVVEVGRYDIHGRLLSAPTSGVNIIKYSDGSIRKEIVK